MGRKFTIRASRPGRSTSSHILDASADATVIQVAAGGYTVGAAVLIAQLKTEKPRVVALRTSDEDSLTTGGITVKADGNSTVDEEVDAASLGMVAASLNVILADNQAVNEAYLGGGNMTITGAVTVESTGTATATATNKSTDTGVASLGFVVVIALERGAFTAVFDKGGIGSTVTVGGNVTVDTTYTSNATAELMPLVGVARSRASALK